MIKKATSEEFTKIFYISKKSLEIAFICSGNIMRSPYAEFHARSKFNILNNDRSKDVIFKSGGVTYQNQYLHPEVRSLLLKEGFEKKDLESHTPRLLSNFSEYFEDVDVYFAMTKAHKRKLMELGKKNVFLLKELDNSYEDIQDPYFNPTMLEDIFATIKRCVSILVDLIPINLP